MMCAFFSSFEKVDLRIFSLVSDGERSGSEASGAPKIIRLNSSEDHCYWHYWTPAFTFPRPGKGRRSAL